MDITEFIQFFLAICGGISLVGGAAAVIFRWIAPAFRLNKRVEVLEDHDKRDFEALKRIEERDALILKVLSTMLDSQITGNNVEELKKTKKELTEYLAKNLR
nr:CTP synthase [uncultured Blautia sp.]